jgi:hypothetical protein
MKSFSVFVIIMLNLLFVACNGQSPVKSNDDECNLPPITDWEIFKEYYEDGTVKNLYPLRNEIEINFIENSGINNKNDFLEIFKVDLKENYIFQVNKKICVISGDSNTNIEIRNALINHKLVESIFPNYINADGDKYNQTIIRTELLCLFKEGFSESDCKYINAKYNAKIVDIHGIIMTVSFSKCTNLNEASEAYFKTGFFKYVRPSNIVSQIRP